MFLLLMTTDHWQRRMPNIRKYDNCHNNSQGQGLTSLEKGRKQWRLITGWLHRWENGIVRWKYLATERVRFSDRRPALDCAARYSARYRRSAGRHDRPPSQCWRSVGCLHFQPMASEMVVLYHSDTGGTKPPALHGWRTSTAYRCRSSWKSVKIWPIAKTCPWTPYTMNVIDTELIFTSFIYFLIKTCIITFLKNFANVFSYKITLTAETFSAVNSNCSSTWNTFESFHNEFVLIFLTFSRLSDCDADGVIEF